MKLSITLKILEIYFPTHYKAVPLQPTEALFLRLWCATTGKYNSKSRENVSHPVGRVSLMGLESRLDET
jgi:hypothetical protein